jgi:hypothetical protein
MTKPWSELSARERDALVARALGWVDFWEGEGYVMAYPPNEQAMGIEGERAPVPPFSTDIAAAWQIVEEMYKRGLNVSVTADHGWRATWECCIHTPGSGEEWPSADADTPMLAICRAALKVLEATTDAC